LSADAGNVDWQAATDYVRRFASVAPDNRDPAVKAAIQLGYRQLGVALVEANRASEAAALWKDLIARFADDTDLHAELGQALLAVGDAPAAIGHLTVAAGNPTATAAMHTTLGIAHARANQPEAAAAAFDRALALRPGDVATLTNLADSLQAAGRTADAIARYREALAVDADSLTAGNNLAWVLATAGDDKLRDGPEAVRQAERVLAKGPKDNPSLLSTLAAAYAAAGRFPDAVRTMQRVVNLVETAGKGGSADVLRARLRQFERGEAIKLPPPGKRSAGAP
jgi:spermidine synthase